MTTSRVCRVGLNAHLLNLSSNYRSAGINWYIYHLVREMVRLQAAPLSESGAREVVGGYPFRFSVFLGEPRAREHLANADLVLSRWPTRLPLVRIAWEQLVQPLALRNKGIDLYHALAFAGPLAISIPWVVTIYDLSFIHFPESFNAANRIYLRWAVRASLERADRIIAISESTRRDLVQSFGTAPDKVVVVPCGTDAVFSPARNRGEDESWRERLGLPSRFILYVGTLEPRKNIARLVRAFARARRAGRFPHRLVLAGARGWKYRDLEAAIEQEGVTGEVVFAGYVPRDDLPRWYRLADLFVYPSLYEGFGLPPLEAMACGTPVVTSNAASLPEVVGDAALVVSPHDEAALADAIVRGLQDRSLRSELTARGLAQAAQFTWNRAARETMDVYSTVLHAPGLEDRYHSQSDRAKDAQP